MTVSLVVVLGLMASALGLGWGYFRRYQMTRPPLGVLNLWDVGLMIGMIIVMPYLYLLLPLWMATALLALAFGSAFYVMAEPVLRSRGASWAAMLTLLTFDIGAARLWGAQSAAFIVINDGALLLLVAGLANLRAQSGMRARDVALLAGVLAVYDLVATGLFPLRAT